MTQQRAEPKTSATTSPTSTASKAKEGRGSDASPPDEMGAEDESADEAHHSEDTTAEPPKKPT